MLSSFSSHALRGCAPCHARPAHRPHRSPPTLGFLPLPLRDLREMKERLGVRPENTGRRITDARTFPSFRTFEGASGVGGGGGVGGGAAGRAEGRARRAADCYPGRSGLASCTEIAGAPSTRGSALSCNSHELASFDPLDNVTL